MSERHLAHPKYRADIDGLRAVAILSVVGFHAFPQWFRGGFVGVDIFFVISGFLISGIIFGNLEKDRFSYYEFYARRIKRIFPALILVLAASFAAGWYLLLPDEYRQFGKHMAAGAGFVSNLALWNEAGYFDSASDTKPLLHLWSLGIEEQFYIVWPLLLGLVWSRKWNFLALTLLIAAASFAINISTVGDNPVSAFYSPLSRFWELMLGGVLAYLALHKPQYLPKNSNWPSVIGLLLIAATIFSIDKDTTFPGWWALMPTLGAFLIIAAPPASWVNRYLLANPVAVWIGLISYPLYLWHWPLLTFARIAESGLPGRNVRMAVVLAAAVLAWLTYRFVEKPLRFGGNEKIKVAVLCGLMIATGYAGYSTWKLDGADPRFSLADYQKTQDLLLKPVAHTECLQDEVRQHVYLDACMLSSGQAPASAIIGDSHAVHFFYGIAQADKDDSWELLANYACPPISGIDVIIAPGTLRQFNLHQNCRQRTERALGYLLNTPGIRTVVLSFYGGYTAQDYITLADSRTGARATATSDKADLFYRGLENTVQLLEQNGKQVVIVIDNPELPYPVRECIRGSMLMGVSKSCILTRPAALENQKDLRTMLDMLAKAHPSVRLYDTLDLLCDKDRCHFEKDDLLLYRDADHLSIRGTTLLAMDFLKWLSANQTHPPAPDPYHG